MNAKSDEIAESISFAGFRLDLATQRLWHGSKPIGLRPKAWSVLVLLAQRPGALVKIDELLDAAWPETAVTPTVLTNVISELRRTFDDRGQPARVIETVHRRGYRFIAKVEPGHGVAETAAADEDDPFPLVGSPFIGRSSELQRLVASARSAAAGDRQLVLVSGEPGIGKSTLLDQVVQQLVSGDEPFLLGRAPCREQLSGREGLGPLLDMVEQWATDDPSVEFVARLQRYAPSWLAQISWLLAPDEMQSLRYSLVGSGAERLVREGAAFLEAMAQNSLLVLMLDDLHWADDATLDLIITLAQRRGPARILVLGTYRPVDALVHQHSIIDVARQLRRHRHATELPLGPFGASEVRRYLEWRFPETDPDPSFTAALEEHSGGNPLFLGALANYLDEHDWLAGRETTDGSTPADPLSGLDLPHDIRAAIEAQLEQLPAPAVAVLEAASVAGESFSSEAVAAGVERPTDEVEDHCNNLAQLGHMVIRDRLGRRDQASAHYRFVHTLYRRVLYERVAPSRRRTLHQRIGETLERAYIDHLAEHAAELLVHFEHADDITRRLRYRELAGLNAVSRFRHKEAQEHFTQAVAQLQRLPSSRERLKHEANLQLAIGNTAGLGLGFADPITISAFERAEALAREVDAHAERFRSLLGLGAGLSAAGDEDRRREVVDQQLAMVHSVSPQFTAQAYWRSGEYHLVHGEFQTALEHLERALHAEGAPGIPVAYDFRICADAGMATALTALGRLDQARLASERALARSEAAELPFGRCYALWLVIVTAVLQRDHRRTIALAEQLHALAEEFGFINFALVQSLHGVCARVHQGCGELASNAELQQAIEANLRSSGKQHVSFNLLDLSQAHLERGDVRAAQEALDQAFAFVRSTDEHWLGAELHRQRAECIVATMPNRSGKSARLAGVDEAEQQLRRALAIAQRQEAKLWELRASTSLARLLHGSSGATQAREQLAELVDWFTEGSETIDLVAAKSLLAAGNGRKRSSRR